MSRKSLTRDSAVLLLVDHQVGLYTGIRITDAQLRDVRKDLAIEARSLSAGVDRVIIGEI